MKEIKVESCLKENGYTFRYNPTYKLARIDIPKAKDNPARLHRSFDAEHCLRMGIRMEAGQEFPAIVVFVINEQEDELATGLHRVIAADTLQQTVFTAYEVVEPDPARRAMLPLLLNTYEGKAPTRLEAFLTISDLIRQNPFLKADALCKMYGENVDLYLKWVKAEAVNERARKLGVGTSFASKGLTVKVKETIGTIKNDNTFVGVVDVLAFTKTMQGQSAEEFVKEVKRHGNTEAIAQRMIDERRRDFAAEEAKRKPGNLRTPSSTSTKYMSAVNRLLRFKRNFSVAALQLAGIPEGKRDQALRAVRDLQCQLDEVAEALARLCEQTEREEEWMKEHRSTKTGEHISEHASPST
jgi:hypothetical protein